MIYGKKGLSRNFLSPDLTGWLLVNCSIVIRAFNESRHLPRLLEGIRHQTVQDVEVILVDSGSTDSTVAIAQSYGAKICHIPSREFTFGHSLNLGISESTREFIVIASAHVYPVYPDWLERLLEPFSDPQVGLTYGKQRGPQTAKFSEKQIFYQWYPEKSNWQQNTPFCNNANAAIRRFLWEKHPYDETLTGLEDVAWAKWAVSQGYRVAYVSEAEIIHIHQETPKGVYNRYRREAMAFKRIFPEAHFSLYDFFRLSIENIFYDTWHALRQKTPLGDITSILWFRLMQFWGTYRGYRHPGVVTPQLRETFYYPRGIQNVGDEQRQDVDPISYSAENSQKTALKN